MSRDSRTTTVGFVGVLIGFAAWAYPCAASQRSDDDLADACAKALVTSSAIRATSPEDRDKYQDILEEAAFEVLPLCHEAAKLNRDKPANVDGAIDDLLVRTTASSMPSRAPLSGRFEAAVVDRFESAYGRTLGTANVEPIRDLAEERLKVIRQRMRGLPALRLVLDRAQPDSMKVRPSTEANDYLILAGSEFLLRIDRRLLIMAVYLRDRFLLANTGYLTDGLALADFVTISEFVDLAPRFNASAMAGNPLTTGVNGFFAAVSSRRLLDSPVIPNDVKRLVTKAAAAEGLNPRTRTLEDSIKEYQTNPYVRALHYYLLRDTLTYLLAHEAAHAKQPSAMDARIAEWDADVQAGQLLVDAADTDVRMLIVAISLLSREPGSDPSEDVAHLFGPQRINLLMTALPQADSDLLDDVDAGQVLLEVPSPALDRAGLDATHVRYRLSHILELRFVANGIGGADLPVSLRAEARHLSDSSRERVVMFRGRLPIVARLGSEPGADRVELVVQLPLPPELWTACPDCEVQVTGGDSAVPADLSGWNVDREPVAQLLGRIRQFPSRRARFEKLALARGLALLGRSDAAEVFNEVSAEAPDALHLVDYLRWARLQTGALRKFEVLDAASRRFPAMPQVPYLAGLAAEEGGDHLRAMDKYFYESHAFEFSLSEQDASARFMGLMVDAGSPQADGSRNLADGFLSYFFGEMVLKASATEPPYTELVGRMWDAAVVMLEPLIPHPAGFAAAAIAADAHFFGALMRKRPLTTSAERLTKLVATRPTYPDGYARLVRLADCQSDDLAMRKWVVDGVRANPFMLHRNLEQALGITERLNQREPGRDRCPVN